MARIAIMEAIKLEESVQARFKHAPELVATFRNVGEAGDFMCWFADLRTCEPETSRLSDPEACPAHCHTAQACGRIQGRSRIAVSIAITDVRTAVH